MNLPEKIEKTIYVNLAVSGHDHGEIKIYGTDYVCAIDSMEEIRLFSFPLTIDLPEGITLQDINDKLFEVLEQQKKQIQAEYHVRLKRVQEKMLALPAKKLPEDDSDYPGF